MTDELKPCPFCGERDFISVVRSLNGVVAWVDCNNCGVMDQQRIQKQKQSPHGTIGKESNMTPQKVSDILIRSIDEDWHVYTDDADDAINALKYAAKVVEKEVPKKPIEKRIENGDQTQVLDVCPVCRSPDIDTECGNYCPKCGQKIDWWGEKGEKDDRV